jgi:hypothetical protein
MEWIMKRCISMLAMAGMMIQSAVAQDLGWLHPVAHYPLINTAEDALGLQQPMELINAPFAGDEGVYSNGIYLGNDPVNGSLLITPVFPALKDSAFAIRLEFKTLAVDGMIHPILFGGGSRRWIGVSTFIFDSLTLSINDFDRIDITSFIPVADTWYEMTLIYRHNEPSVRLYVDEMLVGEILDTLVRAGSNYPIESQNSGMGLAFHGYWRNLKVYGSQAVSAIRPVPASDLRIQVYPNPTSGAVKVVAEAPGNLRWLLYGPDGRCVGEGTLADGEGMIDLASLHPGLYGLIVRDERGWTQTSTRIVRQ